MKKFTQEGNRGFVGLILLILIALVALKYFLDWSVFEAAETEEGKSAISYLVDLLNWFKGLIVSAWNYIH